MLSKEAEETDDDERDAACCRGTSHGTVRSDGCDDDDERRDAGMPEGWSAGKDGSGRMGRSDVSEETSDDSREMAC